MRNRFQSLFAATLLVACAPRATSLTPDHPAHANAPTGRLAGPPPALRPGVAALPAEPAAPDPAPTGHEHHTQDPAKPNAPAPTEPKKAEPETAEPEKPAPKKTAPEKAAPKPAPKKPAPKPAPDPHKDHEHH